MTQTRKDLYSGIFFLAFGVFLFIESFNIRMSTSDSLGPQFFPRIVSIIIVGLAVFQIVKNFAGFKADKGEKEATGIPFNLLLILTIVLLFGYFFLLDTVGFILLTIIYLFCQMYLLLPKGSFKRKKTLIMCLATSIVMPIAIYLLFYYGFRIFLPAGVLG